MPAFTTNVEFGYWLHTGKILYGRPDDARKIKYLDWLYETNMNSKPYNSLEELLIESKNKADELEKNDCNKILPIQLRKIMK